MDGGAVTLRALFAGCWFRHGEPVWEGDHLRCLTCGTVIEVLPQRLVTGPAAIPEPVRGQPKIKATHQPRQDNVIDIGWKRSER